MQTCAKSSHTNQGVINTIVWGHVDIQTILRILQLYKKEKMLFYDSIK